MPDKLETPYSYTGLGYEYCLYAAAVLISIVLAAYQVYEHTRTVVLVNFASYPYNWYNNAITAAVILLLLLAVVVHEVHSKHSPLESRFSVGL